MMYNIPHLGVLVLLLVSQCICEVKQSSSQGTPSSQKGDSQKLYTIEGRVDVSGVDIKIWAPKTRILIDGGRYVGYIKSTGEFKIHNIPSGTYLVEVTTPNYIFEPARVDISSKTGKIRARKVNVLKPNSVMSLQYPLKFKTEGQASFFEKREPWNIMDVLKNPMVIFLVAPLLLMLVLPKLLNNMDPDATKEMQESMQAFQQQGSNLPSMEELFTNFFGGGSKKKSSSSVTKKTKQ